jgi:hypothetical protein
MRQWPRIGASLLSPRRALCPGGSAEAVMRARLADASEADKLNADLVEAGATVELK